MPWNIETWKDVQNKLQPGDSYVELVRIDHIDLKLNKDTDKNIDLKYILQDYKPSDDSKNIDLLNDDNYEEVSGNLELKNVFNIRELLKEIIYAIEQKINIDNKGGMTIKTNETDSGR